MSSDDEYLDWRDNDDLDSGDDEYHPSGDDDDDEFGLQGILDDDAFDEPRCPNPRCRDTNLHFSGSLSICVNCRSVQSSGAVVSTTDAFPYRPLVEDSELRLLLVWPPTDDQDPIRCSLIHGRLGFGIEYDAISYTWADETGDDSPSKTVFINSLSLPVTATCEAVLRRARLKSTTKVLWIDAICINQADTNERGHQVRLMPDIYSHAKKVLIFPGEATDEDSRGLYYLPELEQILSDQMLSRPTPDVGKGDQSERPPLDISKTVQHTLKHLFSRRYFTRVWILQEIALAREPVILYGIYEVPWITIRSQITRSWERWAASTNWSNPLAQPLLPSHEHFARTLALGTPTVRGPADLLDILDKARGSQAHDPRDKVFALFGMIHFASRFGLVADYNQSIEEAYAKVAVLLAAHHGLLPILARTVGTETESRQAIASWIPDWSTRGWGMADKSLPKFYPKETAGMEIMLRADMGALANPTRIPVLARPNDYEMDFVGARVCDVGALSTAGLRARIFMPAKGGIFSLNDGPDSESHWLPLWLEQFSGNSLDCYLPISLVETPTYQDGEHLERELKNHRDAYPNSRAADLLRQRHREPQCELILSSGRDGFCFAGICILPRAAVLKMLSWFYIQRFVRLNDPTQHDLTQRDPCRILSRDLVLIFARATRLAQTTQQVLVNLQRLEPSIITRLCIAGHVPTAELPTNITPGPSSWSTRELIYLYDLLQANNGKDILQEIGRLAQVKSDWWWPVDFPLTGLLGDDPVEVQRLTLGLKR